MRLSSKGLGRTTLPFSLRESSISNDGEGIWLRGRIREKKVNWTYKMRLEDEDIVNFVKTARNTAIITYIAQIYGLSLLFIVARRIINTFMFFFKSILLALPIFNKSREKSKEDVKKIKIEVEFIKPETEK